MFQRHLVPAVHVSIQQSQSHHFLPKPSYCPPIQHFSGYHRVGTVNSLNNGHFGARPTVRYSGGVLYWGCNHISRSLFPSSLQIYNDCFGRVVLCCFAFLLCCCYCLAFLSISRIDCSCTCRLYGPCESIERLREYIQSEWTEHSYIYIHVYTYI